MNSTYPEWVPPLTRSHMVANVTELVRMADRPVFAHRAEVRPRRSHRHAFVMENGRYVCEICDMLTPECFVPLDYLVVKY